jgi:hypothetical protein
MVNILYLNRYNNIIQHFQNTIVEGYYEKHHIIPKCLGGTDEKTNLVLLPTRVHFIAHALLHKAYPNEPKLAQAFGMMVACNKYHKGRKYSSRLYEMSKLARSNAMKGIPRPEWVKEKLRVPKLNKENYKKPKSKEHAENISKALIGKKKTKEHLLNLAIARKEYLKVKKIKHEEKINRYRELFVSSKLNRKDFSLSQNIPYSTMKKYLRGL